MEKIVKKVSFLRLCLISLLGFSISASADDQPNILLIVSDDQGYADLGIQGSTAFKTPHLDALAASGVRCTNAYVTAPVCSPSRAGFLAGRCQQRFGHYYNTGGDVGLPTKVVTIAQRMKDAGYRTGAFGKWHLGHKERFHPNNRGFDLFYGHLGGSHGYFGGPMSLNKEIIKEKEYLTDAIARETIKFINSTTDKKPFFAYCAFNAPHTPLHAKEEHTKLTTHIKHPKHAAYAAMMISLDENIGRLVEAVRKKGIEENTLIIFMSDNGGMPPNYPWSNNTPLKGGKGEVWEGGLRVPFFVSWKGQIPAGKTFDGLVSTLDIATTSIATAGVEAKPDWKLEGVNLIPLLKGETKADPERALYWRWWDMWAVRKGNMKLVHPTRNGQTEPLLYDLSKDIAEENDLIKENPEIAADLQKLYTAWNKDNIDPLWGKFGQPIEKMPKKKKKAKKLDKSVK